MGSTHHPTVKIGDLAIPREVQIFVPDTPIVRQQGATIQNAVITSVTLTRFAAKSNGTTSAPMAPQPCAPKNIPSAEPSLLVHALSLTSNRIAMMVHAAKKYASSILRVVFKPGTSIVLSLLKSVA